MLQLLADGVWLFPHDPERLKVQPSVGVICDQSQTILIDGGNSSSHAQRVRSALTEINAPPVRHVIYTHHHWDHVFGAQVFGVSAVGHVLCQKLLSEQATQPWGPDYLEAEIKHDPRRTISYRAVQRANSDWQAFHIVVPELTFTDRLAILLDNETLELEHVGGPHAPDSIVVRVKKARVMFVGDCFYPGWENPRVNWKMLSRLLSDATIDTFVSSHMKPVSRRERLKFWGVRALARVMFWRSA
jgi:glyoxylase-like metal-dependent hydrolase (beta-lactamase superfamily II)